MRGMHYLNFLDQGLCGESSNFSTGNALYLDKVEIDQNSLITNQEWREWQSQDKNIKEIINLLKDKKLTQ